MVFLTIAVLSQVVAKVLLGCCYVIPGGCYGVARLLLCYLSQMCYLSQVIFLYILHYAFQLLVYGQPNLCSFCTCSDTEHAVDHPQLN